MRPRSDSKTARLVDSPGASPSLLPRQDEQPPDRYITAFWNPPFGNTITTIRRDATGKVVRGELKAEHASFILTEQVSERVLSGLRSSRHVLRISPEGKYTRVCWADSRIARKAAAKDGWFAAQRIEVLEADVDPIRRWIADKGIQIARPRRVYLDLETDSRIPFSRKAEARILCWSLVNEDGSMKRAVLLPEDTDDAEEILLRKLWAALQDFDQVIAWNGDRFDFEMIDARSKHCGIPVERRRWLWLDHLVLFRRMNASASESGEEKQSMALGSVAKAVLGADEQKLVQLGVDGVSSWGMWSAGGEEREKLRLYCLDDSDKMRRIEEKTGYVELLQSLCEATHCFPDTKGINPTQQVEGFLMALGRDRGMRFPTHHYAEEGEVHEQFRGAFVMEPTRKGILRDVHVADFARLYPSIILSWNMSPETWARDVRLEENPFTRPSYLSHLPLQRWPIPEGHCAAAGTDAVFVNEPEGILPAALREMLRLRKEWDAKKKSFPPGTPEWKEADRRSTAYKIAANSFFGVVGSPFSRFFERTVGESITQSGVWLIQETIKAAEARGWRVVYGDTDSIFVMGCSEAEFRSFVEQCNRELYPLLLGERKCSRNTVALDYEKAFDRIVFVGKKRYAGKYLHFKGARATEQSKAEIKGLEYKRGDANRLAREMQKRAIDLLMAGEESQDPFLQLVEEWRERILKGELVFADVVNSKRLSKSLREYVAKEKKDGSDAALPSHVEVAKLLRTRGRDVGAGVRIEFLVVDGSSSPIKCVPGEDWETIDRGAASMQPTIAGVESEKPALDRYYLWEAQVYPPTMRVLEAAFPAGPWGKFERVRPPRLRGRAAREPGLPGLDLGAGSKARPVGSEGGKRSVSDRSDTGKVIRAKGPAVSGQGKLFG